MKRRDELLVGLFLIIVTAVGVLGTIWLVRGGFAQGYQLYARFPWGSGLKVGQPVQLAGVDVGLVAEVKLEADGTLLVRMSIEDQYGIPVGTTAQVVPVGIFGDAAVALTPIAPSSQYIPHGDTLVVGGNVPSTAELLARADSIERNVSAITVELERQLVAEGGLADLRATMRATNQLVAQLGAIAAEQSRGLTATMESARRSVSALDSTVIDSTLRNLQQASANSRELTATLGQTTAHLNTVLAQLQSGSGTAGRLMNDSTLYVDLRSLVQRLDSLASDLQRNPKKYVNLSIF